MYTDVFIPYIMHIIKIYFTCTCIILHHNILIFVFTVRYLYLGKRCEYFHHTIKDRIADSVHTLGVFPLL